MCDMLGAQVWGCFQQEEEAAQHSQYIGVKGKLEEFLSSWTLEAGAANLRPRKTMQYNLSGGRMAPRNAWKSRPADNTALTFSLDTW